VTIGHSGDWDDPSPFWLDWFSRWWQDWASPPCASSLEVSGVRLSTAQIRTALTPLTFAGVEFSIHRSPSDQECSVWISNLPPCQEVSSVKSRSTATTGGLTGIYLEQNILISAVAQPEAQGGQS
jgi:hypothetical protein